MNSPWNGCNPTIPTTLGCFATCDFNHQHSIKHVECAIIAANQQMGLMWCHRQGDVNVWHKLGCFGQQLCPLCCLIKSWCFLPTTFCCSFVHLEGRWHCQSSLHRSFTFTMYNGNITPLIASTHPSFTMMMPPPIINWLVHLWGHDLQVDDKKQ